MIQFYCIQCGHRLESLPGTSGQKIDCPGCGAVASVPLLEDQKTDSKPSINDASELQLSGVELFRKNLRLVLGVCVVAFFAFAALAGIYSILSMQFGGFQAKVMLTAVSLGVYSLTGLCSSILLDRPSLKPFAIIGIAFSLFGAFFAILTNWEMVQGWETVVKVRFSLLVLAFAHAHASLLLMIKTDSVLVKNLRIAVLVIIAALASVLLTMTQGLDFVEAIWPVLAVAIILDVFGTLSIPVLHFATRKTPAVTDNAN